MDVLMRMLRRLVLFLACAGSTAQATAGDNLQLHEQEIKAGLLYNFLKYTEWPDASFSRSASVTVCVFAGDPFEDNIRPMEGRTVNQRDIAVRRISGVRDAEGCHLLFIHAGEKKRWPDLREFLSGKNILTVSDFSTFTSSGGMIEFGRKGSRIDASLNIDAVNAAGLHVEERLLRLVTLVHSGLTEKRP